MNDKTTWGNDDQVTAQITSSTNLQLVVGSALNTTNALERQVADYRGATVQTGTTGSANRWEDNSNFVVGERYLIVATGYHNTRNNTGRSGLHVTHGGVSFGESEGTEETDRVGTGYKKPYFWFTIWTAANDVFLDNKNFFRLPGNEGGRINGIIPTLIKIFS